MAESPRPRRSAGTWFQSLYVRVLLRLLPHLINVFKHVSPKIRAERTFAFFRSGESVCIRHSSARLGFKNERMAIMSQINMLSKD